MRGPGGGLRCRLEAVALSALVCVTASSATAQTLTQIEDLARVGRARAARSALDRWFDVVATDAARDEQQRALWLRGLLTLDPASAALTYQRLAVEFPGGAHADLALARLGRVQAALGRPAQAADAYERLLREFPSGRGIDEARAWLAEHAADVERARSEAQDRGTRPAEPAPGEAPEGGSAIVAEGEYSVQVGAFSSDAAAAEAVEALERAGFEARIVSVPPVRLRRVRVGRFATREEAAALRRTLIGRGFEALVVDDARRERGGR